MSRPDISDIMFIEFCGYLFFSEAILTKASKREAILAHVLAVIFTEGMRFFVKKENIIYNDESHCAL